MSVTLEQFGLDQLSPEDRMALLELLWDSLDTACYSPPDWHIRELEKRVADADKNPGAAIPWEEFKARWLEKA